MKFRIITEKGKRFIWVRQIVEYSAYKLNTKFGIPSSRTIRDWATKGFINRPLRNGREVYYEINYILGKIKERRFKCQKT